MPAAQFSHATAGTIVFSRSPERHGGELDVLQASVKSSGGARFVKDPEVVLCSLPLSWRGMTSEDLQSLEGFFLSVGISEQFTYTDTDGAAHTVYIDNPEIKSSEIAIGRHDVSVELVEA